MHTKTKHEYDFYLSNAKANKVDKGHQEKGLESFEDWDKLMRLLDIVEVDEKLTELKLTIGKSKITMRHDGTIRIDGKRIIEKSDVSHKISSALIDLN